LHTLPYNARLLAMLTLPCRRARMYRALVPPDQLNPQGYTDGNLANFMPTQGVGGSGA